VKRFDEAGAIGAATIGTGAALTAGVAGACCVGPALAPIFLAILGSSGLIAVSTLRPYTPWMLLGSAAMLAFSFRQAYRPQRCPAGGAQTATPIGTRVARVVTWAAAVLWLASTVYAIYGLINE
jgi:hypothetical protein